MATVKQQQALEKIVEYRGNTSRAMREVGYAETSIHNPSSLTSSKGYKELLAQSGLTEGLVTRALVADIKAKKGKRTAELALGAELLGMRKMGVVVANQINIETQTESMGFQDPELAKEMASVFEQYLKAKLSNQESVTIQIVR